MLYRNSTSGVKHGVSDARIRQVHVSSDARVSGGSIPHLDVFILAFFFQENNKANAIKAKSCSRCMIEFEFF